jgi:hypothetical protein
MNAETMTPITLVIVLQTVVVAGMSVVKIELQPMPQQELTDSFALMMLLAIMLVNMIVVQMQKLTMAQTLLWVGFVLLINSTRELEMRQNVNIKTVVLILLLTTLLQHLKRVNV